MTIRHFDVVIMGGGVSGTATALSILGRKDVSVCIIEESDFSEARIGETIPPDSSVLLHELGVWPSFAAARHLPSFGSHSTWGTDELGHNDFLTSAYGHGWHLDRCAFDTMLLNQAQRAGATVLRTTCQTVERQSQQVVAVQTPLGRVTSAKFVDATGRQRKLMRAVGASCRYDDRQTVIWARFSEPHQSLGNATWLEALPYGWWYAANLPGERQIVALGTEPYIAKSSGFYDPSVWRSRLEDTEHICPRLANGEILDNSFKITASDSYLSDPVVGANWIAVGDAASTFDPITSAGIHKALTSGRQAAKALLAGDWAQASGEFAAFICEEYKAYLRGKSDLYAREMRWPDAPFWAKRQSARV